MISFTVSFLAAYHEQHHHTATDFILSGSSSMQTVPHYDTVQYSTAQYTTVPQASPVQRQASVQCKICTAQCDSRVVQCISSSHQCMSSAVACVLDWE